MHILIITDAWHPQVNGVVRTYEYMQPELAKLGRRVEVIGPSAFKFTMPMPGYSEIRLALLAPWTLPGILRKRITANTYVHIATEGPLGRVARKYCLKKNIPFSTCYHTEFPDYLAKRVARYIPSLYNSVRKWATSSLRKFHDAAITMFVATQSLEDRLRADGYKVPISRLTRGVDRGKFYLAGGDQFSHLPKSVALYLGRVAIEKNLDAFLDAKWQGSKVVAGSGPDLPRLKAKYPDAHFIGPVSADELAACYSSADIFVFPSKTDTFGMVLVEALACGLPVAAYPVTGPVDIITSPELGALNDDLSKAMRDALQAPGTREDRSSHARANYSWELAARQFSDGAELQFKTA